MAKYLFYCINGTGLGHITRCLAVARKLRRQAPDSVILFVTSSEQNSILWQEGFTSVKVPSYEIRQQVPELGVSALTTAIVAQVFASFRPDVTVVDSIAGGMFGELVTPLYNHTHKAFLFGNFPNYLAKPSYQAALPLYDLVLMPMAEEERDSLAFTPKHPQTYWVGDIMVRSRDEMLARETVRRRLGLDPAAFVLYLGLGGGGNPQAAALYEWMLGELARYPGMQVVVPQPPLAAPRDWSENFPAVRSVRHFPMAELLAGFDAAISATGFNCAEFVYAGLPTVWLPLGFPSTDQDFNADRFAGRGLGRKIKPFDTAALHEAVAELLNPDYRRRQAQAMVARLPENGADRVAGLLRQLAAAPIR